MFGIFVFGFCCAVAHDTVASFYQKGKKCCVAPTRRLSFILIMMTVVDAVAVAVVVGSVIIELCLVGRYHRNSHVKADAIRIQIKIKIFTLRLFGFSHCKIVWLFVTRSFGGTIVEICD